MICTKWKIIISVYFVKKVVCFILNIVSTNLYHENENKLTDTAFDLQEIKIMGQSLYINIFSLSVTMKKSSYCDR